MLKMLGFLRTSLLAVTVTFMLLLGGHSQGMGQAFDCKERGASIRGRPSAAPIQTDSMQLIDVCLRHPTGSELKLRIPAAYLTGEVRDPQGRLAFVNIEFWLPDYRPVSAIAELKAPYTPQQRADYQRANEQNRVRVNLGAERRGKGGAAGLRTGYEEVYERVLPDKFGLEHFTNRSCEKLSKLKAEGRDISTRKCQEGVGFNDIYFGQSDWSQDIVYIPCQYKNKYCRLFTLFQGHISNVSILEAELSRWREYEDVANRFMNKYLIDAKQGAEKK